MKSGVVMVIDDDREVRETMTSALEAHGLDVIAFDNGATALAHLRDRLPRPDAILLDLMMPEMDGWAFRVEQTKDAQLAAIPVVAMTASPLGPAIRADHVLYKPFGLQCLYDTIDRALAAPRCK